MRKKKSKGWQVFITILLVCAVIFYISYQAYRSVYSEVTTELAVMYSTYESIETTGLVYRTEKIIPAVSNGQPYYAIENGTRVANNSVIASVYRDAESGRIEQQIEEIDNQIAAFKTILADAGSGRLSLGIINNQTTDALLNLVQNTENGNLSSVNGSSFEILSLLSKKALVTGKDVDFSKKIEELEQIKADLKKSYQKPISTVKAPVAGYFADHVDGYEETLTTENLLRLTTDKLAEQLNSQPNTEIQSCGKIVSGYEWYLACIVPDSDSTYNKLGVGRSLTLRMSFVLDEPIPVTVYACNKDNEGNMAVVFRCDQMSAELSTIRKETVEIQLVEHTGLKVPQSAILFNDEQEVGVYIRSGNAVAFRKVKQKFNQRSDYAICEIVDDDEYLQMYDDIIVGGRELYDGKIIR